MPPAVGPGDRVGVAALSGPVDPDRLAAGLASLRRLGFEPVAADNLGVRAGLFAGADRERVEALHRLADDPSIAAILFARGGHGVLRCLPLVDWSRLARRPRAFVGYSDATPFLLEIVRRFSWVAYHGPMVAAELARGLSTSEEASLLAALAGRPTPPPMPDRWYGTARRTGPLLGGCLSLLTATLGTPYAPDLEGAVLFWEDIGEPLYRLDRMLTHLRLSARLAGIEAMLVGHLLDAAGRPLEAAEQDALAGDLAGELGVPVGLGLPSGHAAPNLTLPLGLSVTVDAAVGELGWAIPETPA